LPTIASNEAQVYGGYQVPPLSGLPTQQAKVISQPQQTLLGDGRLDVFAGSLSNGARLESTPRLQTSLASALSPRVATLLSTSVSKGDTTLSTSMAQFTYPDNLVAAVRQTGHHHFTETEIAEARAQYKAEKYDYDQSTEENHCVRHFVGDNADIRPLLDHTFHRMYHASRVEVQDALIQQFLGDRQGNELIPWVIFTAGAMGAGKGYIRDWMNDRGYLPVDRFVVVDPDAIRQALPEWEDYVKHDPEKAGDYTQKEAGMIAEVLGYRALRDRLNVVFDGSLRNASWYKYYFQKLRLNFPGVRIMILHIVADKEDTLKRAEERGKKTGRYVPRQTLIDSMEATPLSVHELAPCADFVCRVLNLPGQEPQVVREPDAPYPHAGIEINWDLMRTLWEDLDPDHDGMLSAEELQSALQAGIITQAVINSIDADNDGCITKDEILEAQKAARKAGSMSWH
jgi:hypothetical protein